MEYNYSLHVYDDVAYLVLQHGKGSVDGLVLKGDQVLGELSAGPYDGTYKSVDLEFLPNGRAWLDTSVPRSIREEINNMNQHIVDEVHPDDIARCEAILHGLTEYQQRMKDASIKEFDPPKFRKDDGQTPPASRGRG